MVCTYCGSKTQVVNSRRLSRANAVWRRRQCVACSSVFTSIEQVDLSRSFSYKSSDSALEPFKREVLLISVYEACKHLKQPETAAMDLTDTIIGKVCADNTSALITRELLVTTTTEVLQRFNSAAGVSYRAFHPSS